MLAQVPAPSSLEVGGWLVAAAGIVGILVLVLTLIEKWRAVFGPKEKLTHDEQPVTWADMERHIVESYRMRERDTADLKEKLKTLDEYCHREFISMGRKLDRNTITTVRIAEKLRLPIHDEGDGD